MCRELCLCLRVHSTTRSYACGWFPNTVCAPDAAQRSSLLPMSHWALYDLDDRGRVRLLLPVCRLYAASMRLVWRMLTLISVDVCSIVICSASKLLST